MDRTALLASLTQIADPTGVAFDDDRYVDWSTKLDDGGVRMEAGDGDGNVAQLDLSHAELVELHTALTLYLLREDG
jgi:hypothetical protein